MKYETSHTFGTAEESHVIATIDPEEPQCILIDCQGDDAHGIYFSALRAYRELQPNCKD